MPGLLLCSNGCGGAPNSFSSASPCRSCAQRQLGQAERQWARWRSVWRCASSRLPPSCNSVRLPSATRTTLRCDYGLDASATSSSTQSHKRLTRDTNGEQPLSSRRSARACSYAMQWRRRRPLSKLAAAPTTPRVEMAPAADSWNMTSTPDQTRAGCSGVWLWDKAIALEDFSVLGLVMR